MQHIDIIILLFSWDRIYLACLWARTITFLEFINEMDFSKSICWDLVDPDWVPLLDDFIMVSPQVSTITYFPFTVENTNCTISYIYVGGNKWTCILSLCCVLVSFTTLIGLYISTCWGSKLQKQPKLIKFFMHQTTFFTPTCLSRCIKIAIIWFCIFPLSLLSACMHTHTHMRMLS